MSDSGSRQAPGVDNVLVAGKDWFGFKTIQHTPVSEGRDYIIESTAIKQPQSPLK
jgi:hypothetical protein